MDKEKELRAPASIIGEDEPKGRQALDDFELDEVAGGQLNKKAQKWWDSHYKKIKKQIGAEAYGELMDELTPIFLDPSKHGLKFLKNRLEALGVDVDDL